MNENRIRICLAVFALLSTGVFVNTLVLQPKTGMSFAVWPANMNGTGRDPAAGGQKADESVRRDVARELNRLGYLTSRLLAKSPMSLHAAIVHYQLDSGDAVSGLASDGLLGKLILRTKRPKAQFQPVAAVTPDSRAAQVVGIIQAALRKKGYTIDKIDGQLGEQTVRAIREYQMDKGWIASGRVSAKLFVSVLAEARGK